MTKQTILWVKNLYEVGSPIRNRAESIQNRREEVLERFNEAKRLFDECNANLNAEAKSLEADVAKLWTQQEIDAAKRGKTLADGVEFEGVSLC